MKKIIKTLSGVAAFSLATSAALAATVVTTQAASETSPGTVVTTTAAPSATTPGATVITTTTTPSRPPGAPIPTTNSGTAPVAAPIVTNVVKSSNHGYILAQGTINQPYGNNPYRTLTITTSACDSGFDPHISMALGGVAGWADHTIAEVWAVPTSVIKYDGSAYNVNYRAEARYYNGSWAWSSNVYIDWKLFCIPANSFSYTPH
jgi:hypothetical protein